MNARIMITIVTNKFADVYEPYALEFLDNFVEFLINDRFYPYTRIYTNLELGHVYDTLTQEILADIIK